MSEVVKAKSLVQVTELDSRKADARSGAINPGKTVERMSENATNRAVLFRLELTDNFPLYFPATHHFACRADLQSYKTQRPEVSVGSFVLIPVSSSRR